MKALILGCEGATLSPIEREHFKRIQPLGFILLERNCKSPEQVSDLVHDLRSCVDHPNAPVLIDQEGGRVQRLKAWCQFPAAYTYVNQPQELSAQVGALSRELARIGVNVNCAPCCDILFDDTDPIIGDRALGKNVEGIAELADAWLQAQNQHGITGVIKHLPGHGRAKGDSHLVLPRVEASLEDLQASDMAVFKELSQKHPQVWGMTAHIVYDALDSALPATHSPAVIQKWIREWIGFKGLLLSDCLYMNALSGPLSERASKALDAGCDVALFCTIADMKAQLEVAQGCGEFKGAYPL